MGSILQELKAFVKHSENNYAELPEPRMLAYLHNNHAHELFSDEKKCTLRMFDSILHCGCMEYSRQYRDHKFWRYLTVGVALHFHPKIADVPEEQAKKAQELLCAATKSLYPHSGYRIALERIAYNNCDDPCPEHFHLDILPFHISDADKDNFKNDLSSVLREVEKSQIEIDVTSSSTGEIHRQAVNGWLHQRLWSECVLREFVNNLNKKWLTIQRGVFGRRLPRKEVGVEGLVSVKWDDPEALNPLLRTPMDHARISGYAKKKSKLKQKCRGLSFNENTGIVRIRFEGKAETYTALEAFRRFFYNPARIRPKTKGLLHGGSKFALILDEAFLSQIDFENIFDWVIMSPLMLRRAMIFISQATMGNIICDAARDCQGIFTGKYYLVLAYLAYLHPRVNRRERHLPVGDTAVYPISKLMKIAREDNEFIKWLDHLALTGAGKGQDAVLERALCRARILNSHRKVLEERNKPAAQRSTPRESKQPVTARAAKARKPKRPVHIVQKALLMQAMLDSGECVTRVALAKKSNTSPARVTQLLQVLEVAPKVIKLLSQFNRLPRRISERFLRETLRHIPRKDQMRMFLQRGGSRMRGALEQIGATV